MSAVAEALLPGGFDVAPEVVAGIDALAADEQAEAALEAAARACRHCSEPVRLLGRSTTVDGETGEILESFSSADTPGGEVLKACGTRRASRCPACAATYQGDARQLVRAGITGGKGVEESVASHPMVFATLTAPSFGAVHRRPGAGGPCQARGPGRCQHGRSRSCLAHHGEHEGVLGAPLCPDCYDSVGAVLFNAQLSELWRRTVIYTRRRLARLAGITPKALDALVRLSYVKVAEFQRRGVVHLHVIVRLDGAGGGMPPAGFSAAQLALALRIAAGQVSAPHPEGRGEARWGEQLECAVLDASAPEQVRRVANYLAKYSTKGSDDDGALDRRLCSLEDLAARRLPPHLRRMAETAWRLGELEALKGLRLRRWAHGLGLRAHFLTKSRGYSTTFKALRAGRQRHRRAERLALPEDHALLVLAKWCYVGRGWRSRVERFLVEQAGRQLEEARRFASEQHLLARGVSP
ncbi:MAG: replication initiation protein [Actinomycetota bacterium]|nr:replication initiation protein [Actinomycetota bacterium]